MAVVATALCGLSASATAPLDVRVALVIGNSAYESIAALENPVNDATAMAGALKQLGFTVTQVHDGSRAQMVDAIKSLGDRLRNQSGVSLFYYAGHGLQLNWRNYMVPVNAKLSTATDVSEQSVDLDVVMKTFKTSQSRMNIVVLDACRDNPFSGAGGGKGLAQMDAPPGTFLAYATAPGNVADDGSIGSNGLYTGFLLRELTRPASKIEDVFKRVRLQVRQSSNGRQVPWESTSLEEDFFFNDGIKHSFKAEELEQLGRQTRESRLAAIRQQEFEQASAAAKEQARLSKAQAEELAFQREKAEWDRIAASRNPDDFYAFLLRYPSGSISELANAALERLARAQTVHVANREGMVQVAARERFRLGDKHYFIIKDEMTKQTREGMYQVTKVDDETVEVNDGQDVYTREGAIIRNRNITKLDPPRLDLPAGDYVIGKSWKFRSLKTVAAGNKAGSAFAVSGTNRVAALEVITIPAGTFKTYRVELEEFAEDGSYVKLTRWMLPDWGFPIKTLREMRRRYGGPDLISSEMTSRVRVGS